MAMSPNTKAVIEYLQGLNGKDVTAADVAEALGLEKRQVDGSFTSAIQRKNLGYREEAEIEVEIDGVIKHQTVKFLKLNDAGMAVDTNAEEA